MELLYQLDEIHFGEAATARHRTHRPGIADPLSVLSQKQAAEDVAGLKDLQDLLPRSDRQGESKVDQPAVLSVSALSGESTVPRTPDHHSFAG
ncbi:MAG: hypothetical protein IPK19_39105, partial [Chloroflexi bacterium]|nr:hypothetical protein [Chloroflexota bacterium]